MFRYNLFRKTFRTGMKIAQISEIVEGRILCGESTEEEVACAFASDLMSDVLTLNSEHLLLITGLSNMQTIRTAEMADIRYILFVRNKIPTNDMIELANANKIVVLTTPLSMYKTCGNLFGSGLDPVY